MHDEGLKNLHWNWNLLGGAILLFGLALVTLLGYLGYVAFFGQPGKQIFTAKIVGGFSAAIACSLILVLASASWQSFLAVCTWLASAFFLFLVPAIVVVPYLILKASGENGFNPESLAADKTFILLTIIAVVPAHALTILVAWAVVTSWGKRPFWETIRWSWPENFGIWKRVSMAALAVALLGLGSLIAKKIGGDETDIDQIINSSFAARIALAVVATATAPFVEEVIYRGVLYSAFERACGSAWAVLAVSVMFAGVHVVQYRKSLGVIAVITMLSVSLTLVRALTGRLLPCVVMHLVFNGVSSIYIVMQPYLESPQPSGKPTGVTIHVIESFISQLG